MLATRFVVALLALGAVSAQDLSTASFGHAVYEKVMQLLGLGQVHLYEKADGDSRQNWFGKPWHHGFHHEGEFHHGHHHGHWHEKMRKKMEEAHACHMKCGKDVDCHSNCPKPWAPYVKACQEFPAIQKCRSACNGADCDKCPKFEVEWLNKKFAKNPVRFTKKSEEKCPILLKASACHKACSPGDFECHHKCHSEAHKGWHHHGDHHHGDWHEKMHKKMEAAHKCHEKCGSDADCHSKCPKPWAPIVKACQDLPAIKTCHDTCKDEACAKCPTFDMEWMNKKFAEYPAFFEKMADEKCPMILKAHACHKACKPGDHECHHKCPHGNMFNHHGHPDEDHHKHWHKLREMMKEAKTCHKKCFKDVECHEKCPKPWAPFVKACQDFPAIKDCRTSCKDAECDKCPRFEKEWMNKKMSESPELVMKMAEMKCPNILKVHECHKACKCGDHACHHQCPKMFPGHHVHHGYHHGKGEDEPRPDVPAVELEPILV